MVRNEEKYELAEQYRKRGFTYAEIAKICEVSKATVSNWLKDQPYSARIAEDNQKRAGRENAKRLKLMQKARGAERSKRYKEAIQSAENEFSHYKKDSLFISGLAIYMASGDVAHETPVRLSTNRFPVQRTFISFIQAYTGLKNTDIRLWLLLHVEHDEIRCLKKWSKEVNVHAKYFTKSQLVRNTNKPLHFGTLNTIIGSTVLKKKLLRWLELYEKELQKR